MTKKTERDLDTMLRAWFMFPWLLAAYETEIKHPGYGAKAVFFDLLASEMEDDELSKMYALGKRDQRSDSRSSEPRREDM